MVLLVFGLRYDLPKLYWKEYISARAQKKLELLRRKTDRGDM